MFLSFAVCPFAYHSPVVGEALQPLTFNRCQSSHDKVLCVICHSAFNTATAAGRSCIMSIKSSYNTIIDFLICTHLTTSVCDSTRSLRNHWWLYILVNAHAELGICTAVVRISTDAISHLMDHSLLVVHTVQRAYQLIQSCLICLSIAYCISNSVLFNRVESVHCVRHRVAITLVR